MTVTELLDLLKITKQSLGRVLKQLVDTGFIEQRTGPLDRRQRLLSVTPAGHALAMRLAAPQSDRIRQALKPLPDGSSDIVRQFLLRMLDESNRPEVKRLTTKP